MGGLGADKQLKILIYAVNVKGKSEVVVLEASTLRLPEKQTGKMSFFFWSIYLCRSVDNVKERDGERTKFNSVSHGISFIPMFSALKPILSMFKSTTNSLNESF